MAKKKPKYVKQYFMKRPPGSGYFANRVQVVPEGLAKEYQKQGYCRDATQTLPEDLPGSKDFIAAGIESLDEIKELDDLTSVKGIGESTADKIVEWFKNR